MGVMIFARFFFVIKYGKISAIRTCAILRNVRDHDFYDSVMILQNRYSLFDYKFLRHDSRNKGMKHS